MHHVDLATVTLTVGDHPDRDSGVCLLEAVAWFAGEPHTDHPSCVSSVLGVFGRAWNDATDDDGRARLVPYIPRLVGTADPGQELRRTFLLADAAVRVFAPIALRAAGLKAEADQLAGLGELVDEATARSAAWSAARSAARSARSSAAESAESAESAAESARSSAASAESAAASAESAAESVKVAVDALLDRLIDLPAAVPA